MTGAWRRVLPWVLVSSIPILLVIATQAWPPNALEVKGASGLLSDVLSLIVTGTLLVVGLSFGLCVIRWIGADDLPVLDRWLFALTIGLGVASFLIFALGMIGLLYPWVIATLLGVLLVVSWPMIHEQVSGMPRLFSRAPSLLRSLPSWTRLTFGIALVALLAAFLSALTPPTDYDGLMYHLVGPRSMLEAHRILPDHENWWNNYPFAIQMLFLIGLAFRTDVTAKLINLAFGCVFLGTVVAASRRLVKSRDVWLCVAPILAVPPLTIWASSAYIDLGNATFVGLGFLALLIWREQRANRYIVLAGIEAGLAISSKYTGLIDFGLLFLVLMWLLGESKFRGLRKSVLLFALPAVVLGLPWYLKNWIWLGSPFFPAPLPFIASVEPSFRLGLNTAYVQNGFGTGRSWLDLALLPVRLYTNSLMFGQYALEMPSLLFPSLVLWLGVRRRALPGVLILGSLRFGLWAVSSQQSRFLLPCFFFLSIACGQAFVASGILNSRRLGFLVRSLVIGMVTASVSAGLIRILSVEPWRPVLGLESRKEFLHRALDGFPALEFIADSLPSDARVFLVGDGRRYYCPPQCIKEVDQFGWTRIALEGGTETTRVANVLCSAGVTHILVSWPDINYLVIHDPDGRVKSSIRFLLSEFVPTKLRIVYTEEKASLYKLECAVASAR